MLLIKALELFLAELHGVTLTWLVAFQSLRSISDIWGKKCHGTLQCRLWMFYAAGQITQTLSSPESHWDLCWLERSRFIAWFFSTVPLMESGPCCSLAACWIFNMQAFARACVLNFDIPVRLLWEDMCLMNNELCCFLSGTVSNVSVWGCDMAENLLVEL